MSGVAIIAVRLYSRASKGGGDLLQIAMRVATAFVPCEDRAGVSAVFGYRVSPCASAAWSTVRSATSQGPRSHQFAG
jgi:hypothetical protein